jgi:hypothetical protein
MRLLRQLANYILLDQKIDEEFRQELNVTNITDIIKYENRWYSHIFRIDSRLILHKNTTV